MRALKCMVHIFPSGAQERTAPKFLTFATFYVFFVALLTDNVKCENSTQSQTILQAVSLLVPEMSHARVRRI